MILWTHVSPCTKTAYFLDRRDLRRGDLRFGDFRRGDLDLVRPFPFLADEPSRFKIVYIRVPQTVQSPFATGAPRLFVSNFTSFISRFALHFMQ